jgi:NAD(P)-dependent dehydrogenase (short-subunit alcohol dehydrogenase family)
VELDVTDPTAVDAVLEAVAAEHGRLDILVNNAGVAQPAAPLTDTSNEVIERLLAVNLKGVLYCSRVAGRLMIAQQRGRIVNIASQAGKCGAANWVVYSASKAAVIAATQGQALELARHSITVNCVCPGPMSTDMTLESFRKEGEESGEDWERLLTERARSLPVGRLGTPEDVGAMVAWIASDEAAFTTGAAFNLTGGESVFF